jgi:aminopeptidase N
MEVVDPDAIHFARNQLRHALAQTLREQWHKVRESLHETGPYQPEPRAMGRRALRNLCMSYLMETGDAAIRSQCLIDFRRADNMTDAQAALAALAQYDIPERSEALQLFHAQWKDEALVLDKWFAVQATSRLSGTLDHVTNLLVHPSFDIRNPNKVRSLIGAFCMSNHVRFHSADGRGYAFAAEQIIRLDPLNPQVAARLARSFDRWRKFDAGRQRFARTALEKVLDARDLSRDVAEVVSRALA